MARTVQRRQKFRNRPPLTFVGNPTHKAHLAEKYKGTFTGIPAPALWPPNSLFILLEFYERFGQSAAKILSQISKEDVLPSPPPNKPCTRSSSKISSQDTFEEMLARISLTPSQRSKKGILKPAAFNKPCTRSRSKITGSAK